MSGSIFTTIMTSAGAPFGLLAIGDGVFSPASPIAPAVPQQVIPNGVERAAVRVEDIYINSFNIATGNPENHALNLWYRPASVTALPQTPNGPNNYTLIYAYAGKSNVNPFHENDDAGRRLKKLVFGDPSGVIPFGGKGTLQFEVGAGFTGTINVTIHWSLVSPGGGIGT